MEKKKTAFFGGEIIRKSPHEHFTERQMLHGSPYSYVKKYGDYEGGTPEARYVLWQFDDEKLKDEIYQTASEKDAEKLEQIAEKWEDDRREEEHIKELRRRPRAYWKDTDKQKYGHIKTVEEEEIEQKNAMLQND